MLLYLHLNFIITIDGNGVRESNLAFFICPFNAESDATDSKGYELTLEGITSLELKQRYTGSMSSGRKFKSLTGIWFSNDAKQSATNTEFEDTQKKVYIGRGTVINVSLKGKIKETKNINGDFQFRVIAIMDKYYNKLFMSEEQENGILVIQQKYRVQAVMLYYDPVYQSYSDVKVSTIKDLWYANDVFILLDASKIKSVDEKV